LKKTQFVYRNSKDPCSIDSVNKRVDWLEEVTGVKIQSIRNAYQKSETFNGVELRGNIENLIGVVQIPVGVAGPLKVNGKHAKGTFYVPLATTEGAIVESYMRGMWVLTKAGGVTARVLKDIMHISPSFTLPSLTQAIEFVEWVKAHFKTLKAHAESTTEHGVLLRIEPQVAGSKVFLKFIYSTKDAMGLNMVNISVDHVCKFISQHWDDLPYYLRVNYSGDKKVSAANFINGYGKEVAVECIIPHKIVTRFLGTTPEEMVKYFQVSLIGTMRAGIVGINAHYANGLAAIFIACGQDVAQITSSAVGYTHYEVTPEGDLKVEATLPNLLLGTIGGGTALPTQKECLQIMGCSGKGKSKKFAEIVASCLLAGEISICAALSNGTFVNIHKHKHKFTKYK
jgi:hydroxymethylglutaryl-CoA reductase (NADPH)